MENGQDTAAVAVIIPTYNHAHFLAGAIESVLRQSERPQEILVVDDGSRDRPEEVVAEYSGARIVHQENTGLAAARNRGLRETSAPYVLFLDADDRLTADAIDSGIRSLATDDDAAFTYGRYETVDSDTGRRQEVRFRPVPRMAFADFLRGNQIGMHGTVLYRRAPLERAGGFREHLRACEDYDLYLRLALDHPILCHADLCAEYWRHDSNMSADPAFMLKAALRVLRDYRIEAERRGLGHFYRRGVLEWKRYYAEVWRGMIRRRPMPAMRTGIALLTLAPAEMIHSIGAGARDRLRR